MIKKTGPDLSNSVVLQRERESGGRRESKGLPELHVLLRARYYETMKRTKTAAVAAWRGGGGGGRGVHGTRSGGKA